jgi:hypothetical protein
LFLPRGVVALLAKFAGRRAGEAVA